MGKVFSRAGLKIRSLAGASPTRWCSACRRPVVGFFSYGMPEWGCPLCGASSRERMVNAALDHGLLRIDSGTRVLHMAPSEISLARRFATMGQVTFGDIDPSRYVLPGVERIDLMDMSSAGVFERIYASHVLEHVPDDRKVLRNIYEHLVPGGAAWLIVPLHDGATIDGTADLSARERERRFGQWDHVRQYGVDLAERMQSAGFEMSVVDSEGLNSDESYRCGLWSGDKVFVGLRRS